MIDSNREEGKELLRERLWQGWLLVGGLDNMMCVQVTNRACKMDHLVVDNDPTVNDNPVVDRLLLAATVTSSSGY